MRPKIYVKVDEFIPLNKCAIIATAYETSSFLCLHSHRRCREIGQICVDVDFQNDLFQIGWFKVKEEMRHKGVGRKLLDAATKEMKKIGQHCLTVYPNTEPYEGDCSLSNAELYEVYRHLGFEFTENTVDIHRANNKMKLLF